MNRRRWLNFHNANNYHMNIKSDLKKTNKKVRGCNNLVNKNFRIKILGVSTLKRKLIY